MNQESIERMVACFIQDISCMAEQVKAEAVVAIREAKPTTESIREQRRFEAAKAAMVGLMTSPWHPEMGVDWSRPVDEIVAASVQFADALLAELDKRADAAREGAK